MRSQSTQPVAPSTVDNVLPGNRSAAGVTAEEVVDVDIELDVAPREVTVHSHRKEWVRWIEQAKKPETRVARVSRAVESLRNGKQAR